MSVPKLFSQKLPVAVLALAVTGLTAGCRDDTSVTMPTRPPTASTPGTTTSSPSSSSSSSTATSTTNLPDTTPPSDVTLTTKGGWSVSGSTVSFVYRNGMRWSVDTGGAISDPRRGTYRTDKGTLTLKGSSATWQPEGSLGISSVTTAGGGTVVDNTGVIAVTADGSVVCATNKKLAFVGPDGSKGAADQGGAVFVNPGGTKYSVGKPSSNGTMVGRYSVCNPGNRASVDVFADVLFPYDGDQLTPQGKVLVKSAADTIRGEVAGKTVSVVGHTDSQGTPARNLDLGQRRAQAVATELQRQIPGLKVSVGSAGQTQPTAPNSTEEGRAKNRRVVISWAN